MNKPDDAPQDVWDEATRHAAESLKFLPYQAANYRGALIGVFSRAILAEREACAVIVDDLAWVIQGEAERAPTAILRRASSAQKHAVETAAAAIRSRS